MSAASMSWLPWSKRLLQPWGLERPALGGLHIRRKKWHERLHKVTNALRTEQNKRLDELKQHKKKEEAHGNKILGHLVLVGLFSLL